MKISELIRKGCEMTPHQTWGTLVRAENLYSKDAIINSTCALGALIEGYGGSDFLLEKVRERGGGIPNVVNNTLRDIHPTLFDRGINLGSCNNSACTYHLRLGGIHPGISSLGTLATQILMLNDHCHLTREEIVEKLEAVDL